MSNYGRSTHQYFLRLKSILRQRLIGNNSRWYQHNITAVERFNSARLCVALVLRMQTAVSLTNRLRYLGAKTARLSPTLECVCAKLVFIVRKHALGALE